MDKIQEITKYHKKTIICIVIAFVIMIIIIPAIINCMFKRTATSEILAAEWTAADALSFYGTVLSFLSTALLSSLALWQNHVVKQESNKYTTYLREMEHAKNMPIIFCRSLVANGNCAYLKFELLNLTDNVAFYVVVSNVTIKNPDGTIQWSESTQYTQDYLTKNESFIIQLSNPMFNQTDQRLQFYLQYEDMLGVPHRILVDGVQEYPEAKLLKFRRKEVSDT